MNDDLSQIPGGWKLLNLADVSQDTLSIFNVAIDKYFQKNQLYKTYSRYKIQAVEQ